MNTDTVLESVFADYCSPLWETYKILGVRVDDTEGKLCFNNREAQLRGLTLDHLGSKEQKTLLSGMSLLTAEMTDARYDPYRLLTDQNGVVFQKAVCTYMKKNIAYEMAKSVYNHYEAVKEVKKDYKNPDEGIADAMDALKHPEKYETEGAGNSSSRQLKGEARQGDKTKKEDSGEKATPTENPLETVTEVKKEGVLSLVLPENTKVSGKSISIEETVSHRSLEKGTMDSYVGSTLEKKIGEKTADIRVESNFPWEGDVKITIRAKDIGLKLALRIPDWCSRYELDGFTGGTEEKDGYLYLQKDWGEEEEFTLHFPMEVRMIAAKEAVREDIGKVAVMRGPVVYCLEETDNGKDLQKLLIDPKLNVTVSDGNICGTPVKKLTAAGFRQLDTHIEKESEALYHVWKKPEFEKAELSYIPYYTWANRGENEMQVWTRVRD